MKGNSVNLRSSEIGCLVGILIAYLAVMGGVHCGSEGKFVRGNAVVLSLGIGIIAFVMELVLLIVAGDSVTDRSMLMVFLIFIVTVAIINLVSGFLVLKKDFEKSKSALMNIASTSVILGIATVDAIQLLSSRLFGKKQFAYNFKQKSISGSTTCHLVAPSFETSHC